MKAQNKLLAFFLTATLLLSACGGQEKPVESKRTEGSISETVQSLATESSASEGSEESEEETAEEKAEKEVYHKLVANYPKVKTADLLEAKKTGKELLVYVGADWCPYCRKFMTPLADLVKEKNWDIHYYDYDQADPTFEKLTEELKMEYIPAILHVKEGVITAKDTNLFKQPFTKQDIQEKVEEMLNKD